MSVYKPCDIRGPVPGLSAGLYYRWGLSIGRRLEPGACVVVGGDVRASTAEFAAALIDGIRKQGMHVLDLGIVPTPIIYFAKREHEAEACAIITASHNPPDMNGLKCMIGQRPATEEDILALKHDAESGYAGEPGRGPGRRERLDTTEAYDRWLRTCFASKPKPQGELVVVDPGNGCWAGRAARHLAHVFPDARFEAIHDEPDGTFPSRSPDSSNPKYLTRLADVVRARGAALGIAFDGDGDRVAFVDDEGTGLTAEEAVYVLLHSLGAALEGRAFVYDIKFSDRVVETARALGATPIVERSGHAFIRARMLDTRALFGAEISGHYFYEALAGGDDGLYTACRMVVHLAEQGRPLAALRRECPIVYATPDLRVRVPAERHADLIDRVKAAFADYPQRFIDGVRIDFPDGWVLLRASVTEPAVTVRFEAASSVALDEGLRTFCAKVPEISAQLLDQWAVARV